MDVLEVSDIYPVAFLSSLGLNYELKKDISPNGKKRIIFIFKDVERAKTLVQKFYSGQDDSISASKYARVLKELKSLVWNF